MSTNVLSMILAGGEGTRLHPLTAVRAKPSVPFGGNYRIIDFVLSNFINSGLMQVFILTQFKSHSLMEHLRQGWRISGIPNVFIDPIPAQMQTGKKWYEGTADAISSIMSWNPPDSPPASSQSDSRWSKLLRIHDSTMCSISLICSPSLVAVVS